MRVCPRAAMASIMSEKRSRPQVACGFGTAGDSASLPQTVRVKTGTSALYVSHEMVTFAVGWSHPSGHSPVDQLAEFANDSAEDHDDVTFPRILTADRGDAGRRLDLVDPPAPDRHRQGDAYARAEPGSRRGASP